MDLMGKLSGSMQTYCGIMKIDRIHPPRMTRLQVVRIQLLAVLHERRMFLKMGRLRKEIFLWLRRKKCGTVGRIGRQMSLYSCR